MPKVPLIEKVVKIPSEVNISIDGKSVTVTGPLGTLKRDFGITPVELVLDGDSVKLSVRNARAFEKAVIGTVAAHIRNMIVGVTKGYEYKLKIVYSHFPMTVKVQGKDIIIENLIGERDVRRAKAVGDTEVIVKDDDIIVKGINIEDVGQTAANIQQATKIRKKDVRTFMDGIYVYEKRHGDHVKRLVH